jgi:hypothetical protein
VNISVDGQKIINADLKNIVGQGLGYMSVRTGFFWLRVTTGGGLL